MTGGTSPFNLCSGVFVACDLVVFVLLFLFLLEWGGEARGDLGRGRESPGEGAERRVSR